MHVLVLPDLFEFSQHILSRILKVDTSDIPKACKDTCFARRSFRGLVFIALGG